MRLATIFLSLALVMLAGCGAITPPHVYTSGPSAYDASTPKATDPFTKAPYDPYNGGFIGYRPDSAYGTCEIITTDKLAEIDGLIGKYKVQLKSIHDIDVKVGDGVKPWSLDTRLVAVRNDTARAFGWLEQFKRDELPADSILSKIAGP